MTIRRLIEIIQNERQDGVVEKETITAYVNALEAKICTEIFLTHVHPPAGVYLFMGMPMPGRRPGDWPPPPPPHAPGYSDEWSFDDYLDIELMVKPPYDDIYRAYVQWRTDLQHNDTIDAGNSQRVYWQAYNEFARFWNRTHMPINNTPYAGYKE